MSSTVLLVDAEPNVRGIIERQLDRAHWKLVQVGNSDQASQAVKDHSPALVVVNVDIAKGWPLCMELKRTHAATPVIVVSFRLDKAVFNNHQKLDTRADAYHRLPEETEGLEISIGYFSSHKSETGHDDEDSAPNRPRARRGGSGVVPSGIVQRLESTLAEQARALEDARRQIEALEVERDAVAEKNRRQMLELMTVSPSPGQDGGSENAALKARVAALEAEVLLSSRREDELRELREALSGRSAELDKALAERASLEAQAKQAAQALEASNVASERTRQILEGQLVSLRADKVQLTQHNDALEQSARRADGAGASGTLEAAREQARREASDAAEQLAQASAQLSNLASELTQAHQARLTAERERRAAEDGLAQAAQRAESAEKAWSGVNARLEQVSNALSLKTAEVERLVSDKKLVEEALATSRRLMREYATDAARKAEELKSASERVKELEARASGFDAAREELQQALEFEKSLVESLEKDLAAARAAPATPAVDEAAQKALEGLRAELEATRAGEEALRAELARVRDKAAADLEKARSEAGEDLETLKLLAQMELDEALAKGAEHQAAVARVTAERDEAVAGRSQSASEASALLAAEREALANHVVTVHTRFGALVAYARALEARLVEAETRRGQLEGKLEALVIEVRGQALSGEIPPPMELPASPLAQPGN